MADVPVIGVLSAWRIKSEMGRKAERQLTNLVAKVVEACVIHNYGQSVLENVYLAGFEHGATLMERRLASPSPPPQGDAADPRGKT